MEAASATVRVCSTELLLPGHCLAPGPRFPEGVGRFGWEELPREFLLGQSWGGGRAAFPGC